MSIPTPLDFANTWQSYTLHNMRDRLTNEGELAFWLRHAVGYDSGFLNQPDSYRQTLNIIGSLLQPNDTLLDVGAGSGRFAVPLAQHVRCITALDLSPDMLAILHDKCQQQNISNITLVESAWENAMIEQHDVVLAAWSMYRQGDILAGLQKLVDTTKRVLILVDGDYAPRPDDDPPHERLRNDIWGAGDPGICNYLYFAGMLRQLQVRADLRVVYEQYSQTAESVLSLAQSFAPQDATATALDDYARLLTPYIQQTAEGVVYTCRFAVGLVIWEREGRE